MPLDNSPTNTRSRWARAAALLGVLAPGAVTSVLALGVVFMSTEAGTNLMLWHVAYIVPMGAIVIGLVASSGITIGARLLGVRLTGFSLAAVCALFVSVYFAAEYVGFHVRYPNGVVDDDGAALGFWAYLDYLTRLIHFGSGKPLGVAGYAVRVVGLGGFVVGGIFGPMYLLAGKSHCEPCQRYMTGTIVAYLPATNEDGLARIAAHLLDPHQLGQQLHAVAPGESWHATSHEPERVLFRVLRCPNCGDGAFVSERLSGLPDQTEGRELSRQAMTADALKSLLASWNQALQA